MSKIKTNKYYTEEEAFELYLNSDWSSENGIPFNSNKDFDFIQVLAERGITVLLDEDINDNMQEYIDAIEHLEK